MVISKIVLKNWRNFRSAEFELRECTYVIGPNASGKSNLLDALRFLRDLSKPKGGGLQFAVSDRGGLKKLRCLHARQQPNVSIEVYLNESFGNEAQWIYKLSFKNGEGKNDALVVSHESVFKNGKPLIERPDKNDGKDPQRLTQTYLEQIGSNESFRDVVNLFSQITYLHLVPHLLKNESFTHSPKKDEDPFGQGFLERIAKTPKRVRTSRLNKIQKALRIAVPNFEELKFVQDEINGTPHLEARYKHHRPQGAWQREDQFSDGTIRLLGILWSLLDGVGMLLIEEPELSLNEDVVKQIPVLIDQVQKKSKIKRQVIITTHSESLLRNEGIDPTGLVILESTQDGTKVRSVNPAEKDALASGFSISEVVLKKNTPNNLSQLSLF